MNTGRTATRRGVGLTLLLGSLAGLLAPESLPAAWATPALPSPLPPRRLRTLAHDPEGYSESQAAAASDVLLGDLLFHSPKILGRRAQELKLSCQTCHPNGATHRELLLPGLSDRPGNVDLTTGFFRAGAENSRTDALNIPSLRGVRYTAPYGLDGRTASLSEFIAGVVVDSFDGRPLSASRLRALVRYVEEQDFLPNRNLDSHNHLGAQSSDAARRGEQLFLTPRPELGSAGCATCHPPSSMFADGRVHRIGSGQPASPYSLDDAYETPTLLGTAETAPYFHDGRFATLAAVVDFFDVSFHLKLKLGERADLVAYLEAIGATDLRSDDRTTGQRLAESAAYLGLLCAGEAANDSDIWDAALTAVRESLTSAPQPPTLKPRIDECDAILRSLHTRAQAGADLAQLRLQIPPLRRSLLRLFADWTGALGY